MNIDNELDQVTVKHTSDFQSTLNRFTFEEKLLNLWHIVEELDTIIKISESEDIDDIQNAIIGLKTIYNYKFQDAFDTFEDLIRQGKFK